MNLRKSMSHPAVGATALVLAACVSGTALAQNPSEAVNRAMTVRYADLNLDTTSGATTLYHRIEAAARFVCDQEGYLNGIEVQRFWNPCYQTAVNDAVARVHSPLLTQVAGKAHAPAPVTAMLKR